MTSPARAELTQRVMTQRIHFSFASEDVNEGQPILPLSPRAHTCLAANPIFLFSDSAAKVVGILLPSSLAAHCECSRILTL
jgi:hypothetical protein